MALDAVEQDLFDLAVAAMPGWFVEDERVKEWLGLAAKVLGSGHKQVTFWMSQSRILIAEGAVTDNPDWLNQHALDRGTSRQSGETDAELRQRIRNVPDVLIRPTLLTAAQDIVDAGGITGFVAMVEVRRDRAYFRTAASDTGTGGTFAIPAAGSGSFEPTVPYAGPPFKAIEEKVVHKLVISGASSGGNDGTFQIQGLVLDAAGYQNASQVAEADAGATWTVTKHDRNDNDLDGFQDAYLSRGDRMGSEVPGAIIIILPFGCTSGTQASVLEMLRQKKGAGILGIVECRTSP